MGADADGIEDSVDNCPTVSNSDQINTDNDTLGNAVTMMTTARSH
ncbi:MAG: hypothetical protein CM15mP51_25420 [Porticoccaceae bacterium]|nr:MAG: hypothetical protein CM15mP51_25420 [Porticoccaceae bacterium]